MLTSKINILIAALYYYDDDEETLLSTCKNGVSAAHHTLLSNLIDGLVNYANVTLLSSLPIGSFPKMSNSIIVKSNQRALGFEVGYINLPIVKDIIRQQKITKEIVKWYKCLDNKENSYVLIYDAAQPFIKGAINAKKIINQIKNVLIIPDLPGDLSIENNTYSPIINYRLKQKAKLFYSIVGEVDAFIPLTRQMMTAAKLEKKPFMVMECIVKPNLSEYPQLNNNTDKILMYAGELSCNVNLDKLIKAIKLLDNCKLLICGRGSLEKIIKEESRIDNRIEFLGFVPKQELKVLEKDVDIFVKPRQESGNFTQYSFPSKNAEYLLTGKPVVAYRLSGMPPEYCNYLYIPNNNSPEAMAKTINQVMNMTLDELLLRGKKQIDFMNNKSSLVQGKRITHFLKGLNDNA